jgi:hypothetical protein
MPGSAMTGLLSAWYRRCEAGARRLVDPEAGGSFGRKILSFYCGSDGIVQVRYRPLGGRYTDNNLHIPEPERKVALALGRNFPVIGTLASSSHVARQGSGVFRECPHLS